ncbi:hypothetical protein [Klebsiella pneumoniae IS39]|nr:hypothetical protein [Klebsiella pneumoniae IS39]
MGVSKKIELSKIQYNHVVMIIGFVPIIAPPQSKTLQKTLL